MPINENEVPLSLSTICGGKLEEQFQETYPALLAALKEGSKAAVTIRVELARVKDTASMVNVGYKLTPTWPGMSKASVCQTNEEGKLITDKPAEKLRAISLFDKEVAVNE